MVKKTKLLVFFAFRFDQLRDGFPRVLREDPEDFPRGVLQIEPSVEFGAEPADEALALDDFRHIYFSSVAEDFDQTHSVQARVAPLLRHGDPHMPRPDDVLDVNFVAARNKPADAELRTEIRQAQKL